MSDIQKQLEIKELVDQTPVREKLLELKQWQTQMKSKEKELKLNNNIEANDAAPIRSRAKQNGTSNMVNGNSGGGGDAEESEGPENNPVVEETLRLANVEKERGNKLVAVKDYANAIGHYSKAIEYHGQDPAFYMNRALCHLRMEKHSLAIADCDSALALDKSLTKAYFRRMQGHTHLENYDAALSDCIQMIKQDANNPSLRKEFDRIKQLKIDKESGKKRQKPSVIALKPATTPEEVHWEPKPKKLWSKFGAEEVELRFQDKAPHLRSKKPLKRIPITETFSAPEPVETFPDHIVDKLFNNFTGESTSNGPAASSSSSRSPTALFSPYTPLYGSFNSPKSPVIDVPPSPMSSSALNLSSCSAERSIDDIFGGMNVAAAKEKEKETEAQIPTSFELNKEQEDKTDVMKPVPAAPSPNQTVGDFQMPKNGVQFANTWKSLDEAQRFHYLKQVQQTKAEIISKLGASLDDSLFTELLDCLNSYFCPKDMNIGEVLVHLADNEEMSILRMMMSNNDRETLGDLVNYVKSRGELVEERLARIEEVFNV